MGDTELMGDKAGMDYKFLSAVTLDLPADWLDEGSDPESTQGPDGGRATTGPAAGLPTLVTKGEDEDTGMPEIVNEFYSVDGALAVIEQSLEPRRTSHIEELESAIDEFLAAEAAAERPSSQAPAGEQQPEDPDVRTQNVTVHAGGTTYTTWGRTPRYADTLAWNVSGVHSWLDTEMAKGCPSRTWYLYPLQYNYWNSFLKLPITQNKLRWLVRYLYNPEERIQIWWILWNGGEWHFAIPGCGITLGGSLFNHHDMQAVIKYYPIHDCVIRMDIKSHKSFLGVRIPTKEVTGAVPFIGPLEIKETSEPTKETQYIRVKSEISLK